jgi:hypothetical protein
VSTLKLAQKITILFSLSMLISACTPPPKTDEMKEHEMVLFSKFMDSQRKYRNCAFENTHPFIDSQEPASTIAELAMKKCSGEKIQLNMRLHMYNKAAWDTNRRPAMLDAAYKDTQSGMIQIQARTLSDTIEYVINKRMIN